MRCPLKPLLELNQILNTSIKKRLVSEMPIKTTAGIKSDLKYEHQEKFLEKFFPEDPHYLSSGRSEEDEENAC